MLIETFSGIRGVYEKDITLDIVKNYTTAFVSFLRLKCQNSTILKNGGLLHKPQINKWNSDHAQKPLNNKVACETCHPDLSGGFLTKEKPLLVVGIDTRPSGPDIKKAMIDQLTLCGCDVIDVDINTTPAIELAVTKYNCDAGIIITGSHNEPEYNGWKFLDETGGILEPEDADLVISNFKKGASIPEAEKGKITDKSKDLINDYTNFVLNSIGDEWITKIKEKKFKVVVDPDGGAAALVIKEVLEPLGVHIIEKNMELGVFNRPIEPNVKTLSYLSKVVKDEKADLGAGFDCDADRVELIDDKGVMISGQYVLAFLVDDVLSELGSSTVVVNDATSGVVKEIADKHGSAFEEVEVGEINVVKGMDNFKSVVGGEGSNGGCIISPSRCRDGVQALAFILRYMTRTGKKISELDFPKYYTPRINVKGVDCDIAKVKSKIQEQFLDYKIKKTGGTTGGLKIVIDDTSWIWYRPSKTEEGVFRIITDSKSEEKSEELLKKGKEVFDKAVRTT